MNIEFISADLSTDINSLPESDQIKAVSRNSYLLRDIYKLELVKADSKSAYFRPAK